MTRADYFFLAGPAILFLLWIVSPWWIILTKGLNHLVRTEDKSFVERSAEFSIGVQFLVALGFAIYYLAYLVTYVGSTTYNWINSF